VPIDDVRVRGSIAIYTHASASESLFVGDLITDGSITSDIPALEPGEYFFRCEAHPAMTGIVVEG
jgi:plastocyanin